MPRHAEMLARYQHLRRIGLDLNNRLVERLDRSDMDEGGKKLGILRRNVLTLDTEDAIAVLMDFCLHDVRRNGVTAIERYLTESPPPPDSDEWVLLQALRQARFSLFVVESAEPGVGVHVRDLLRDEPRFLVDVGLGRTAKVGMVLAARVMAPDGIGMTTGAALPIGVRPTIDRAQYVDDLKVRGLDYGNLSPTESSELAATIIRSCLRHGAAEQVEYVDPGRLPARRIGRNDPCPCGCGKKFKRCCGARE